MKYLWVPIIPLLLIAFDAPSQPLATSSDDSQKWEQLMSRSAQVMRDDVDESIRLCDEAGAVAQQLGTNDTRPARTLVLRAQIYLWEKQNPLAEQTFKLAIASCEHAAGTNDVALIEPLSCLASLYSSGVLDPERNPQNNLVLPLYQRILFLVQHAPRRNDRDVIMWSRNLAMLYQSMRRYPEGEPLFQQAVALSEQKCPDWLPYELLNAADFYRAWGKYAAAESLALRAQGIRETALKSDDGIDARINLSVCLNHLGAIYLDWSKPDKAEAVFQRSLGMAQKNTAADSIDTLPQIEGLAAALRAGGKLDRAVPFYQSALDIIEKYSGTDSVEAGAWREKYAAFLDESKKPQDADALRKRRH
jgi:tetratricopeptide (TPR) repeat protein